MSEEEHPDVLRSAPRVIAAAADAGAYDPDSGEWLGGGGGGAPVNWVSLEFVLPDLTYLQKDPPGPGGYLLPGDLSIVAQSGADFSIDALEGGAAEGSGVVVSAAGGRFQHTIFYAMQGDHIELSEADGERLLKLESVGAPVEEEADPNFPVMEFGIDMPIPVLGPYEGFGGFATTCTSSIGYAPPGKPCFGLLGAHFYALPGDTLKSHKGKVVIWQV